MIQNSCRHQAIQLAEARLEHRDPGTRQAVDFFGGVGWGEKQRVLESG